MTHRFAVALLLIAAACGPDPLTTAGAPMPAKEAGPLLVLTVNQPLAYFAHRIGGDVISAEFPGPSDEDPAFWSPEREILRRFQSADLILLNGAGYAKWIERASLPLTRTVDTSAGFRERLIPLADEITHSHGPKGDHSHVGTAFTTWIDPTLATLQAEAVLDALVARLPERETLFTERFTELKDELRGLDESLASAVAQAPDRALLGSHPVYQYLTRRYALNLRTVHWEPDETPDESEWSSLEELLESHPARTMLWEAQPLPEIAERLRKLGLESLVFAPAAAAPGPDAYPSVMRANAQALRSAFAN